MKQNKNKKASKAIREMKSKVRRSPEWAELRQQIKSTQINDPISLQELTKSFNLHHLILDSDRYSELVPENFIGLNSLSHRVVHYLYNIVIRDGDFSVIDRLTKLLKMMIYLNGKADDLKDVISYGRQDGI